MLALKLGGDGQFYPLLTDNDITKQIWTAYLMQ